jgi:hypothetical protein
MKAYTLKVLGTMLGVTLAFTISGAANAEEIYFGSFRRSSIIHFRDVGDGPEFVSETVFPNASLFTEPPDFRDLTLGPDGKLYAALLQAEAVLRFDPATDTFDTFGGDPNNYFFASGISGRALYTGPAGLTFGGPNNDLFVTGGADEGDPPGDVTYVKRFDGTTGAPIGPDPFADGGFFSGPNNIIAHPDGDLLVGGGHGILYRVSISDGNVTKFADVGAVEDDGPRIKGMVFSPDESTLYVGTDDGGSFNEVDSVFRFDASTGEKIAPDPFIGSGYNGFNGEFPVSNIEGLAFSTDGSTLFVGSLASVPPGFDPAASVIYRFDPDSGMPLDGVDGDGTVIQYIYDISTTTSQGGPGTGDPMSPQRIVVLPPPEPDGDFDGSGIWDLTDLNLVLFNWNLPAASLPPEWVFQRPVDNVGLEELNKVLFNWQEDATSIAAVPEPNVCMLAVFGLLALGIHRCPYRQTARR